MSNYKVDITGINTSNLKCLTHEENIKLFKLYQAGDLNAKEDIVNGNLKLVLSVLKNFSKTGINQDDLFQVGVIGLIKAVDNFDLSYNVRFSTYAVPLILGEIRRYLRDNNSNIRISRSIKDLAYKVLKLKEESFISNGKELSNSDISKMLDVPEIDITIALDALREPASLSEPIYNNGGDTIYLEDQVESKKEKTDNWDTLIFLHDAINDLKPKEKKIITERFILGKTQMEIADEIGISQAQVSRLEKGGIDNIKKKLI